jgi:dTDP-4-dehydrorhamnose 3,5-epimerase
MKFLDTKIPGCYLINTKSMNDNRGSFTKIYHHPSFLSKGVELIFKEQYFSVSNKNVLRGMHFQLPPYDHSKLITCISGNVLDVVIDLRVNSPSFMKYESFELIAKDKQTLFIPSGIAHGFISLEDNSGMLYGTSCEYDSNFDTGILWNSFDFDWPCEYPILSDRDQSHIMMRDFKSPFKL